MRGYPKHIATKQDFINLLATKEYREQALNDLQNILKHNDEFATRVVSGSEEEKNLVTEKIVNPMPLWKIKGFENKEEIAKMIMAVKEKYLEDKA